MHAYLLWLASHGLTVGRQSVYIFHMSLTPLAEGHRTVSGGYTTPQRQGPALEPLARIKGDRENEDTPTTGATTGASERMARKPIKLERFDGVKTPLEVFVAKFVNCQRYNGWTNEESVAFLHDSLTGSASQVLWEISDDATHTEIIDLLCNRFGNANQTAVPRGACQSQTQERGVHTGSVPRYKTVTSPWFPGPMRRNVRSNRERCVFNCYRR